MPRLGQTLIVPGPLPLQVAWTAHKKCHPSELHEDELRIGGEYQVHPMNCTRHRLPNGQLSRKVYAGPGVCSGSAVAVSLNEDRIAGRNSASYWVHRAPLQAMLWATINRDHCPYLGPLMQNISGWLFSVFGGTLIFFYLLHFIHNILLWKKMTVPKWSHFHIGNSEMVLLHLHTGKVWCLVNPALRLVPSHCQASSPAIPCRPHFCALHSH